MICFLWLVLRYVFLIDVSGYKSTVSRFKQTQTSVLEDNIGTFFFCFFFVFLWGMEISWKTEGDLFVLES